MSKLNKIISIGELYSFAGVENGCPSKEFINELNKKIKDFTPQTKEELEFINQVKESLNIYNKLKNQNKNAVENAKIQQIKCINKKKIKELGLKEKKLNIEFEELLKRDDQVLIVDKGIEDEYTDEVIILIKERNKKKENQLENPKSNKNYKYIIIPLSLFLIISGYIISNQTIDEKEKYDKPKAVYEDEINYGDNEIVEIEHCYIIEENDTIYDIARKNNVEINDIRYKDDRKELIPELVFPGEEIIITHSVNSEFLEDNVVSVNYRPNISDFSGFARLFNTTEETIYNLNKDAVIFDDIKGKYIISTDKLYVPNFNEIIKEDIKEKEKVKKLS